MKINSLSIAPAYRMCRVWLLFGAAPLVPRLEAKLVAVGRLV